MRMRMKNLIHIIHMWQYKNWMENHLECGDARCVSTTYWHIIKFKKNIFAFIDPVYIILYPYIKHDNKTMGQ